MKKYLAALVLGAALLLPLAAEAQMKDSVVIGMRLEPAPGLDPTAAAAAAISQVTTYNVYECLTRIDGTGKVGPMLAKSWTISEDGLTYVLELEQGVTFHDGSAFDSADVRFNFERNGGENSKNKNKGTYKNVASIETPDAHTVVITLNAPNSLFLFKLAQSTGAIVAPETAETNATDPVGTGPYRFVKWTKGDSVELEKYDGHRNAANVQIKRAKFRFINDATAQVAALYAGDLDYMPQLSAPEMFAQFQGDDNFTTLQGTTEGETILAMNNKQAALSDVRVRRALMHAIDRQALIDGAMYGSGTPIGSHFPPHHPAYVDLTGVYAYDPARAKALLAEAGQEGLELSLKLPPPSYARRGGEVIAAMLAEVGVTAKIENVEWAQWLDQVYKKKQYDLTIVSHVEPMDMNIYTRDNYYYQYESPEFHALWKSVETAVSEGDQFKALQAAQRKLTEDAVNGYLFELAKLGVARKGLTGMWASWPAFINEIAAMSWEG